MAADRPREPEIKVSDDGFNANFSLSPRLDQPPSRPLGSTARGRHHHHNRNHSIDTKDRTSPTLGFGPMQPSFDRPWTMAEFAAGDRATDAHSASSDSAHTSASRSSPDSSRLVNGTPDPLSGLSATRSKPTSISHISASSSPVLHPSTRKVSSGSNTSSTGSASPDATFTLESRRLSARNADRHQPNGTAHHLSEGSSRRTSSPARTFTGAPISPRLQSTISPHTGLAHARRASTELATAPFRAPSPIFLPSASPPTGPANPDPQHSWDSIWPRSSTPDRADQLRRMGSISPVAGSPGRASPSALSDSINLSRSPSTSFDSGSPSGSSTTVLGRPKARRPHELRGSSSSPILRMSPSGLRDSHDPSKSPRRSFETAKTEPVIKIGFAPLSHTASDASRPQSATSALVSPASKVLSPATEASPHVDAATALASHRTSSTGSSWLHDRAESPSSAFVIDPKKRRGSVPIPQALPLPARTPSPKISPTSPRSPFLELSNPTSSAPNGSNMGLSESPPKTRSFIAMPPRSGYDLSDDPDDVGSEEDGSNSERESVGTNDEDHDGSEYDDEEVVDAADAIDDDQEQHMSESAYRGVEEDSSEPSSQSDDVSSQKSSSSNSNSTAGPSERPSLPKRPSLTRSGVVPPPITIIDHVRSPLDPLVQAENSARALAVQKGSTGSTMLNFFRDERSQQDLQPQLGITGDAQISDSVMPSALGLDAGEAQPMDAMMEEGGRSIERDEDEDDEDDDEQGYGIGVESADEGLNTLERIFLFAKSDMAFHRVLVSQSLPDWIREVELNDAVEYIIPLLNGLATDEPDVCAAFAPEVGRVMWFFFRNCPIAELADETSDTQNADEDQPETASRPRISLTAFTTLLCALLLNQNTIIAGATQQSLVQLFYRLDRRDLELSKEEVAEREQAEIQARQQEQDLESYITHASGRDGQPVPHEDYRFDDHVRNAVKNELLVNVALALAQIHQHGHGSNDEDQDEHSKEQHGASSDSTSAKAKVQRDADADEAMEEDHAETSSDTDRAATEAAWNDAMDEEQGSTDASSWGQDDNMFDQQSDGSASDVQIDEDEESAVGRMASVSLLAALAADELIPHDALLHRYAPEVLKLIDDGAFYVRKEVASALGPLSRNMSAEAVEHTVLPALNKAIHDRNWHVRQAACFSIPATLGKLGDKLRREQTLLFMRSLVNDVSRQLRMAALEIIGEVIYMFHETEAGVPEELVRFFLGEPFDGPPQQGDASLTFDKTSDPEGTEALFEEESAMMMDGGSDLGVSSSLRNDRNDQDSLLASFGYGGNDSSMMEAAPWDSNFRVSNFDPERPLVVAYNLPAVVLTLGSDQWSRLKQVHAELTRSDKPKVRKSLAASLHEIAKIVGQDATRDDLLPAATRFLTDDDVEVRSAIFENMDVFLSCLRQVEAERMLSQLLSLWSSGVLRDWRLREQLALHIPSMAKQFLLEDEDGNLVSLMQLALADPISAVRDAGIHCVPDLYKAFAEHDQVIADGFLGMVSDLGDSTGYRLRVSCLQCIGALVEAGIQRSSCELLLLSRLSQMGDDRVVDVRIALSRTLGQMCGQDELYALPQSRSEDLNKLIAKLTHDDSDEVRQPIAGILSEAELNEYAALPREEAAEPRKLVLGPADGGLHRPEGEGGFTSQFVDAQGDEEDGDVFQMDDDGQFEEGGPTGDKEEEESQAESKVNGDKDASEPTSQAQWAQHLEMSRASIFGGAKHQTELDFGSDWVNANGPAFFDYGDNDEDDEIQDDEGLGEEPHHLLNVDRDSSGSGELIENETDDQADENKAEAQDDEQGSQRQQQADDSMDEANSEPGITLSSPQRALEAAAIAATGSDADGLVDSPSRAGTSTSSGGGQGKAADPFLAFVAGRRSQDLSKLQPEQMGRSVNSKRSRLSNGTAAASHDTADSEAQQDAGGGDDEEMMATRFLSKTSGDWSELTGDAKELPREGEHNASAADDDFVQV
ncbi:hypothetical protein EX895_002930 [Sporisorium graminicola]|uniref:Uncharacterized protein n=1 Tax=Sporisorium graminicola TaxID=280036 RepID=A0A4U7KUM4_9BASI|nr:hypothetical protein EX895_002930 [Sporisorium graminicola]TKY88220.1 hypothetical protein EX895_002930 [Sporisorium graminicola]